MLSKIDRVVWPDLAKFRHFGKTLEVFGKFFTIYFLFGKMLCQLRQIYYIIGQILIVANGQLLKNSVTIWSHWNGATFVYLVRRTRVPLNGNAFLDGTSPASFP